MSKGGVTLLIGGEERRLEHGRTFSVRELGQFRRPAPSAGLPADVWEWVKEGSARVQPEARPPTEVLVLTDQRETARIGRYWAAADALRARIAGLGWQVMDTPDGPRLEPMPNQDVPDRVRRQAAKPNGKMGWGESRLLREGRR